MGKIYELARGPDDLRIRLQVPGAQEDLVEVGSDGFEDVDPAFWLPLVLGMVGEGGKAVCDASRGRDVLVGADGVTGIQRKVGGQPK